ncbi:peptidase domain-containing ABC transporter [Marinimicrobium sp. C6131]|uniref:peptidase domain-containing ABC transporter n=1 Tax=Marinimicrobium sp. C6131 TaxID=3022676 RepID=UPI00223DAE36|nr:peptidase domain-containing ABC transporter [Marinimicrobium sp. C6131]UZJ43460.1 peptidase domain-containing ABC transporter [Marinimicrobium sp. C6131]
MDANATLTTDRLLNFRGGRRLPVILQTEMAECGLACVTMLAGYYGFETDMATLRKRFGISQNGVQLKQLMDVAGKMHLAPRAIRAEVDEVHQLQMPCILHWGMNHFVVLKRVKGKKYLLHDPAVGERAVTVEDFSNHFTGVALELTPTSDFEEGSDKQTLKLRHFWSRVTGLKRSLLQILILSLLLQLFAVISPLYMQTVIDDVVLRGDQDLLLVLALGFGLLLLIETGTSALRQFVIVNLSNRLNIQMAANVFRHLIRLPMDFFAKRHMGDIVSRFGSLQSIRELLTTGLITAIVDGIMAIITLVAMLFYDKMLTLIAVAIVLVYALFRWAVYRPFRLLSEESLIAHAKENSHFMESIRGVQTVKLFQKENDRQSQWQNNLATAMNKDIRLTNWGIGYDTVNRLLFGLENIIIIYFGAMAVIGNVMSVGMLYAFISYKNRFVGSMDSLVSRWIEFKMLELHLTRLSDIVFSKTEESNDAAVASLSQSAEPEKLAGELEVLNLTYAYGPMDPPVFKNVSFKINAGESVAIVGPSGSGKTTLLKCLMGLMTPTEGEVLVDGNPLRQILGYRSNIASVMQDDQLLSGDIADNIACFSDRIDMEKVIRCAKMACIHDEIMRMPMQYNTLVGDMGTSLSGGQKQRIVLARALYREPRILFMDEATSHLDVEREAEVNHNLVSLSITRVLVAHRPETVKSAGRRILLETNL